LSKQSLSFLKVANNVIIIPDWTRRFNLQTQKRLNQTFSSSSLSLPYLNRRNYNQLQSISPSNPTFNDIVYDLPRTFKLRNKKWEQIIVKNHMKDLYLNNKVVTTTTTTTTRAPLKKIWLWLLYFRITIFTRVWIEWSNFLLFK
jgi:hypothetical protein